MNLKLELKPKSKMKMKRGFATGVALEQFCGYTKDRDMSALDLGIKNNQGHEFAYEVGHMMQRCFDMVNHDAYQHILTPTLDGE